MFVERLTKEQIIDFFRTEGYVITNRNVTCFVQNELYHPENKYLYVCLDGDHFSIPINNRMYDFEGSTITNESKWRNFLYSIFEKEYKIAYKEYLQEEMDKKLSSLEKFSEYENEEEIDL